MDSIINVLSFDCANKSLGVSIFTYNKNFQKDINNVLESNIENIDKLININDIINNSINILYLDVIDVLPDLKVSEVSLLDRTKAFKSVILQINDIVDKYLKGQKINICIEYQPVFNDKSRTICNQLIYEYTLKENYEIHIVNPSLKNKIYFTEELKHNLFLAKYNSNYKANKNHTKSNFLYFIKVYNLDNLIKKIKKSNLDDIADSLLQGFAFIKYIYK